PRRDHRQGRDPAGPQRLPAEEAAPSLMARDTSPQCNQCRREGQKLFLKGERCFTDKCGVERRSYPPGEHGRGRMRQSEYRQLVRHGHWQVNGRRVDIPSYQVRPNDIISIKPDSAAEPTVRAATELTTTVPAWLQADHEALTAKVLRYPERSEISAPVQEQL